MSDLNIKLQEGLKKALKKIKHNGSSMSYKEIVEKALIYWLDKHEGKQSGAEKRPGGKGKTTLQVDIDETLYQRLDKEAGRRDIDDIEPRKKRAIVEAALIEWMLDNGHDPGVKLPK